MLSEKLITRSLNGDLLFHQQNVPLSRCFELDHRIVSVTVVYVKYLPNAFVHRRILATVVH